METRQEHCSATPLILEPIASARPALQSLRTQRQVPQVGRSCRTRGRPTWTQLRDDYDEVLVPSVPEQHEQVEANVRLVQQKFGLRPTDSQPERFQALKRRRRGTSDYSGLLETRKLLKNLTRLKRSRIGNCAQLERIWNIGHFL